MSAELASPWLQLADYRRQVSELYATVRERPDHPEAAWQDWTMTRDRLFGSHPQSALTAEQQSQFTGLEYYPYDPGLRFLVAVEPLPEGEVLRSRLQDDGELRLKPFGRVHFEAAGQANSLTLYWISGYGGGIFLPFRDGTNGQGTYGGGRYLLDTIKGADLGMVNNRLVLDFNFAYNPSCVYHPRWDCPLAPPANWLSVAIPAGERDYRS